MKNQADEPLSTTGRERNDYQREYREKNKERLKIAALIRKDANRDEFLHRRRESFACRKMKAAEAAKVEAATKARKKWMQAKYQKAKAVRLKKARKKALQELWRKSPNGLATAIQSRHKRRAHKYTNSTKDDFASAKDKIVQLKAPNDGVCCYCYSTFPTSILTIDHVVPLSKGGAHTASNLALACFSCNSRKRASILPFGCFAV